MTLTLGVVIFSGIWIASRNKARRHNRIGRLALRLCENTGGAFPKLGQLCSTRADIFPAEICAALANLQDNMAPMSQAALLRQLPLGLVQNTDFELEETPIACATIAQVHRLRRRSDGTVFALKVLRENVGRRIDTDMRMISVIGRQMARLPMFQAYPVADALAELTRSLKQQTDFDREVESLKRFRTDFADNPRIIVPEVFEDYSSTTTICMEFIEEGTKFAHHDHATPETETRLLVALRGVYQMIFIKGFVHCDPHPGNMLCLPGERVAFLDAGFVCTLDGQTRKAFARFFLALGLNHGKTAADITLSVAQHVPNNLDRSGFDAEMVQIIDQFSGQSARDFNVAKFVIALFDCQRKFGIVGGNDFTMAILALMVFEGVAKASFPDLPFQTEAIRFLQWVQVPHPYR